MMLFYDARAKGYIYKHRTLNNVFTIWHIAYFEQSADLGVYPEYGVTKFMKAHGMDPYFNDLEPE